MKRLLREPLAWFLLIGGGIFLLHAALRPETPGAEAAPYRIEITDDLIEQLTAEWSARWQRPPTDAELKGLLDSYIEEEIYYREAKKLGLDQSDTIIRRRLAQKMEFLTADMADLAEVGDESLAAYYEEHADRYLKPPEVGFRHLFFSTDQRGESAEADARELLGKLQAGSLTFEQATELTDRTMLAAEFATTELPIIGRQFGQAFAEGLGKHPAGEWFGPVPSGYGFHIVWIDERIEGGLPPLDEIRDKVLNDYRYDQREKLNQAVLDEFLEQYEVVFDGEPGGEGSEDGSEGSES